VWALVDGLHAALAAAEDGDGARVQELVARLRATVGATAGSLGSDELDDVLRDLAGGLELYEVDAEARGEEPDMFGEDELAARLRRALARLDELGAR
jgi:gamma-glutamyl:cysteine ligase YbdK (ATP-grasp superfamily)